MYFTCICNSISVIALILAFVRRGQLRKEFVETMLLMPIRVKAAEVFQIGTEECK